jgi:hypothetical protein
MFSASVVAAAAGCGIPPPVSVLNEVVPASGRNTSSLFEHLLWMRANCGFRNLLASSTDGEFGFYLKRVGGAVAAESGARTPVYPASTIKALQHLHAMRVVDSGDLSLSERVRIFQGFDNCSDDPSWPPSLRLDLRNVLAIMMKFSNNLAANAVQDFFGGGNAQFGRFAINQTATEVVGMSTDTVLHHKFACGGKSNSPANRMTLADMGLLYERLAQGELLSPAGRAQMYQLMLNETNNRFVDGVITSEAPPGFVTLPFRRAVQMAHKAGSVAGNVSIAGWIQLPVATGTREFVYGVFVDNFTSFSMSISRAAAELLRDQIALAIATFV